MSLANSTRATPRSLICRTARRPHGFCGVVVVSAAGQWFAARTREPWELIGFGAGIHWPALDENISVEARAAGTTFGESDASFRRWLNARRRPANTRLQPTKTRGRRSITRAPPRRLRG